MESSIPGSTPLPGANCWIPTQGDTPRAVPTPAKGVICARGRASFSTFLGADRKPITVRRSVPCTVAWAARGKYTGGCRVLAGVAPRRAEIGLGATTFSYLSAAAPGRAWQKGRALTWPLNGTIGTEAGRRCRSIRGNCAGWRKLASSRPRRWCVRVSVAAGCALSRCGVYSSDPRLRLRLARLRRDLRRYLRQLRAFPPAAARVRFATALARRQSTRHPRSRNVSGP